MQYINHAPFVKHTIANLGCDLASAGLSDTLPSQITGCKGNLVIALGMHQELNELGAQILLYTQP